MTTQTSALNNNITALLESAKKGELDKNVIHTTDLQVCQSGAGFYIGMWCIEFINNGWCPMPYDRISSYMSKEDAEKSLSHYQH